MLGTIKNGVRRALYLSGCWPLWHRLRNRRRLTVLMFHRVLPADSEALARSEREYAFTVDGFERCIAFVKRHYHVVGLDDLARPETLPPCPALITFDDGWRDTLAHAGPVLRRHGVPAVVFAVPDALDDAQPRWWSDALVEALADRSRHPALRAAGADPAQPQAAHAAWAQRPADQRWPAGLLDPHPPGGERQMLTLAELPLLAGKGLALGAHGYSHAPLAHHPDPSAELQASAAWLRTHAPQQPVAMAFPHGSWTPAVAEAARAAGFRWVFSSVTGLAAVPRAATGWAPVLPRLHVPENAWTCDAQGRIAPERLAAFLFFRPEAG